jgi:hypothetical protein
MITQMMERIMKIPIISQDGKDDSLESAGR